MDYIAQIEKLLLKSKEIALEDPKKSFAYAEQALDIANANQLESEKGLIFYNLAYSCRVMSEYSNGLEYSFKSLDLFKKHNDTLGILKVSNIIGIIYFYFGAYSDSLEYFMSALQLLKEFPNSNIESSITNNIGEIYRIAKEYDKALKFYKKALKIAIGKNLELNAAAIHLNIGDVYYNQHKYKASYSELLKSYDIVMKQNSLINQGEAETKLGRAMFMQGEFELAQEYYLSAVRKFNTINNKFYLIELLVEMAILDEEIGLNPTIRLKEALDHAINSKLENKVSQVYKLLSEHYEKNSDYKQALEYFKAFQMKEKEVEASNLSKRLEILSVEFNYYKEKSKNQKIKQLSDKLQRDINVTNKELMSLMEINTTLMKENIIDELTQLYNRRGIDKMFEQFLSAEYDLMGVVFLIDIDHFKQYNDTWGHIQGDACLMSLSESIKSITNDRGFVGRYGGEEFLCFFKANDKKEAEKLGETIRHTIETLSIEPSGTQAITKITVSIGGFFGAINLSNVKHFVNGADNELYKAKELGRNRLSLIAD